MKLKLAVWLGFCVMLAAALAGCAEPQDFPPKPDTLTPSPTTTTAPLPRPTGLATDTPQAGVTVSTVAPPAPPTHIVDVEPGDGQNPSATPPVPTAQGNPPEILTISMSDNHKTITLDVGQVFLLDLGPDTMEWSLVKGDEGVIASKALPLPQGSQGYFVAVRQGETSISAYGQMPCSPGKVCSDIVVFFWVTIEVR